MIKKIIFDLDDTLILFDDKIYESVVKTFDIYKLRYDEELIEAFKTTLNSYETEYNTYDKKSLINHIKNNMGIRITIPFLNVWLYYLGQMKPFDMEYNEEVKTTLKYLKEKYELIVLTNFFTYSQMERLKRAKLYDYFSEIIGADIVLNKPNREAFIRAIGNNKPEECIMIGDNISSDVKGASNIGMDTILCDPYDKHKVYTKKRIVKFNELKEML